MRRWSPAWGIDPLTFFTHQKWPPPYTHGRYRVWPVRSKTGLAMARAGSVAHQTTAVAVMWQRGESRFAARWMCGGASNDVILLATANSHGGVCTRCGDASAGPCVYRCYGGGGHLLYIGSTNNLSLRMASHRSRSSWWPEVTDVRFQPFPAIAEARIAERLAITAEQPACNRLGVTR